MSVLDQAPRFDAAAAASLAGALFGLDAVATALVSERDQNFRLDAAGGRRFVLKIANASEPADFIEAQNAAMAHASGRGALCPSVVSAENGETLLHATGPDGARHIVRLLTWVAGTPMAAVRYRDGTLYEDLGTRLGALDAALADFDHPAIHRDLHWDLARAAPVIASYGPLIRDEELRRQVKALTGLSAAALEAAGQALPRAAIHSDANDHNVLVSPAPGEQRVAGFIDFGDLVYGLRVADPAIAIAYAVLDAVEPLDVARRIARGYHAAHPLTEAEATILFDLALLRLCQSVAIAASQTRARPDDEYLTVSQAAIARTLPRVAAIPRPLASAVMREACGFEPVPARGRIVGWLDRRMPAAILPADAGAWTVLDLSVTSPLIAGNAGQNSEPMLSARISEQLVARDAGVGVGRYGEPRILYSTLQFGEVAGEHRTIHLGIDLFAPAGTAVHAPLDGTVALLAENTAPLDYGPLVVLEHLTDDGDRFFTLYGHLSRESLGTLEVGRSVAAGEAFASIGDPRVNGGWTPHLHVQLIVDLLERGADFPGVCRASERAIWQAFSPSANVVLRIAGADYPAEALDSARVRAARGSLVGPSVRVGYRDPVHIVRGWMQHLFDASGRRYLDAYNNVPHVGHAHPRVAEAAAAQLRLVNTNTRYLHEHLAEYADRLVATLPDPLSVCYFVNSGTEANELALRLARTHTRRQDVLVLDHAYHGHSTTMIEVSPYKFNGPGGQGARPWVHVAALPDVYRGPYRRADAAVKYAHDAGVTIAHIGRGRLAAFLAETCPSVAGQIMLPPGYLRRVYDHVRAAGGVCIADEVQTGFGRMGTHFYAFEGHGVVPDIVVLGKPIGNGYPLGAVITTREIAASFDNGMEFFSTFGGSTVSCAVGIAVLDVLEEEELQAHALRVGERLGEGLRALQQRHALVGDVRGSGLFWGLELVRDQFMLEPAGAEASAIANRLRTEGILIGTDGPLHNVLKIRPPMPFGDADATRLLEALERACDSLSEPGSTSLS